MHLYIMDRKVSHNSHAQFQGGRGEDERTNLCLISQHVRRRVSLFLSDAHSCHLTYMYYMIVQIISSLNSRLALAPQFNQLYPPVWLPLHLLSSRRLVDLSLPSYLVATT